MGNASLVAAVVVTGIIALVGSHACLRGNVFRGIGASVVCALLLPTWISVSIFGFKCDLRVCLAIVAALGATFICPRWLFRHLVLADIVVGTLCLCQTVSEWRATGDIFAPFILSYGYWVLPYVVGRCSARIPDDLRWIGYLVMVVGIVYGLVALIELTSGIDICEFAFGVKPGSEFHPKKVARWGITRCEGVYSHPIFFATVMMLMLPWAIWLSLNPQGRVTGIAIVASLCILFGSACTISRAPILGILFSLLVAAVLGSRTLSYTLIGISCIIVVLVVARPGYLRSSAQWFAEISGERERSVAMGDEVQTHSSSMSRLLIVEHYWKSVTRAGMMGYGMTATEGFPPNVPHVPFDQVSGKQYPIVDNTYILLTLRGGWLLSLGFVLLLVTAMLQFHGLQKQEPTLKVLSRMMIGAMCAFALVVFTVYPDYDFMFVFLWTVGISSVNLVPEEQTTTGVASAKRIRA